MHSGAFLRRNIEIDIETQFPQKLEEFSCSSCPKYYIDGCLVEARVREQSVLLRFQVFSQLAKGCT